MTERCWWCGELPDYQLYHDQEWGRPVWDDRVLFEKICLEGFQAGLSWLTILRKRENFRAAFANFDMDALAQFNETDVECLLQDKGIVRHRQKIMAVLNNAQCAQALRAEYGSLASYFWRYEPKAEERPAQITEESLRAMKSCPSAKALAKDLKRRGWKFVGETTVYAFMQAMGLVNDHVENCATRAMIVLARQQLTADLLNQSASTPK